MCHSHVSVSAAGIHRVRLQDRVWQLKWHRVKCPPNLRDSGNFPAVIHWPFASNWIVTFSLVESRRNLRRKNEMWRTGRGAAAANQWRTPPNPVVGRDPNFENTATERFPLLCQIYFRLFYWIFHWIKSGKPKEKCMTLFHETGSALLFDRE